MTGGYNSLPLSHHAVSSWVLHFACIFRRLPGQNVGMLGASQMNHVSLALFHLSSTFELIYVKITHKHASVTAKQTERGLLPRHTHRH